MASDVSERERRILRALAGMAYQYMGGGFDGKLDHMCMSAGEDAVKVLAEFGLVVDEGRHSRWTPAGEALLNEWAWTS